MTHRGFPAIFATLIVCLALSSFGLAATENVPDRTEFGNNVTIGPNEQVGDVTCFACSVRIRGQVHGDVTVFGGRVILEDQGQVGGDVTNFGSGVRLEGQAHVGGDVTTFGGALRRDTATAVGGSVTTFSSSLWLVLIFGLPLVIFCGIIAAIVFLVRRLVRPRIPLTA